MIHDNGVSNPSKNRSFQDVWQARISRRNVLAKGMMLSAAGFVTAIAGNKALVQAASAATGVASNGSVGGGSAIAQGGPTIDFAQVLTVDGSGPVPTISAG
ncbi:phosphatase, partial [filamentous cyanobacterium CCP5]